MSQAQIEMLKTNFSLLLKGQLTTTQAQSHISTPSANHGATSSGFTSIVLSHSTNNCTSSHQPSLKRCHLHPPSTRTKWSRNYVMSSRTTWPQPLRANFKRSRRRRLNHLHNYQAKFHHNFHVHFLLHDNCHPIHLQILLISQPQHHQLSPKLHNWLQIHPSVAHALGHLLGVVDPKPALSTKGPSLCLEALGDDLVLTSQHLLDQGRPGVDQGLHMGTHRHGTGPFSTSISSTFGYNCWASTSSICSQTASWTSSPSRSSSCYTTIEKTNHSPLLDSKISRMATSPQTASVRPFFL